MHRLPRCTRWPIPSAAITALPHGLNNSLVLGLVLDFNLPAAEALCSELGRAVLPATQRLRDVGIKERTCPRSRAMP